MRPQTFLVARVSPKSLFVLEPLKSKLPGWCPPKPEHCDMYQLQARTVSHILVTMQPSIMPLTLINYYPLIQRLHSSLVSFCNNVLHSKQGQASSILHFHEPSVFWCCFVFTLEDLFDFYDLAMLEIKGRLFYRMSSRWHLSEMSSF